MISTRLRHLCIVLFLNIQAHKALSHKPLEPSQAIAINWDGSIIYNPAANSSYESTEFDPFDFEMDLLPIFHLEGDHSSHRISLTSNPNLHIPKANPQDGFLEFHRWKIRGGPGFAISESSALLTHGFTTILPYAGSQAHSVKTTYSLRRSSPHKLPLHPQHFKKWANGDQISWESVTGLYLSTGLNFHNLVLAAAETEYRGLWRFQVTKVNEQTIQVHIIPIQFLTAGLGAGALIAGVRKAKIWGAGYHLQFEMNLKSPQINHDWKKTLSGHLPNFSILKKTKSLSYIPETIKKSQLKIKGDLQGMKIGIPFLSTSYQEKGSIHAQDIHQSWSNPTHKISLGGWKKETGSEGVLSQHKQHLSSFFGSSLFQEKHPPHHHSIFIWSHEQQGVRHHKAKKIIQDISKAWGGEQFVKKIKIPRTQAGFFKTQVYINLNHQHFLSLEKSLDTQNILIDLKTTLKKNPQFCRLQKKHCFHYWKAPTIRMMHSTKKSIKNIISSTYHQQKNSHFSHFGKDIMSHPLYLKIILEHCARSKISLSGQIHISGQHIAKSSFQIKQKLLKNSYTWDSITY